MPGFPPKVQTRMTDNQSNYNEDPAPLFAEHKKVYPKSVRGPYRRAKWMVFITIMALYYIMPLLRWYRGEGLADQAVLFDFAGRRLYFFNIEI